MLSLSYLVGLYLSSNVKRKAMNISRTYLTSLPSLIDNSINNFMVAGDKTIVKQLVNELSKDENVIGIHIFDPQGDISYEYSGFNSKYSNQYLSLIYSNFTKEETVKELSSEKIDMLAYYKPYKNKEECLPCHKNDGKIIGVLNINVDMKRFSANLTSEANTVQIILFLSSVMFAAIISYVINTLITRPIKRLENGMKEVAKNNFNVKVNINSRDELEKLSKYFNHMVYSLKKANRQLDSFQKSLIHTDRLMTVGQLTASLSHEIKNPLNSIMVTSDLLYAKCEQMNDPYYLKLIDNIINDAERIRDIISQTLNFSKFDNTGLQPITVKNLLTNILVYTGRILFDNDKVNFDVHADEEIMQCKLKVNKTSMEQVFINLLKNAVESIPEDRKGQVNLIIRQEEDSLVTFIVEDNGIGIPKSVQKNIFSQFYTTKKQGTGLGLSIVKELVEFHDGSITVSSEEGEGTRFIIKLPASDCDQRG
jgi:signal transduction histidine kinase